MQAFIWDVVRAFTKLGIAIAASKPMIATTIIISTNVKPYFLGLIFFIGYFLSARHERHKKRVKFSNCRSLIILLKSALPISAFDVPKSIHQKKGLGLLPSL
jgi:hypothetical protein